MANLNISVFHFLATDFLNTFISESRTLKIVLTMVGGDS